MGGPRGTYSGGLSESPFRGAFSSRDGDLGVAKLESMELPDAAAAVAMLHDMPPEAGPHNYKQHSLFTRLQQSPDCFTFQCEAWSQYHREKQLVCQHLCASFLYMHFVAAVTLSRVPLCIIIARIIC